ncbi:MAG: hypothetical protein Q9M26_08200 [Mariprofundales bacterium]|nr:hypothetical protein [Mariprofundales bacterium]
MATIPSHFRTIPSATWWQRGALPLLIAVMLAITIAINHHTHNEKLTPIIHATQQRYSIPAKVRQHLTLGYNNALAVLYWFGVINDFGGKHTGKINYTTMAEDLNTITILDPYAEHAYYTAATVLTWGMHSTKFGAPLLDRAIKMMPEKWQWPYYRGFYSYLFDHHMRDADRFLAMAAKHPNVPPILIKLAAKMRAEHSGLDTALLFLQQLLKQKQSPILIKQIARQIVQIRTEKVLRALDKVLATIPHWHGDIRQLQQRHIQLPARLPDGGQIIFNPQHQPLSSVEKRRYRLFQPPHYHRGTP